MKKLSYFILAFTLILFVACAFAVTRVKINYDSSKYLPEDLPASTALDELEQNYGLQGSCEVMVKNITSNQALSIYQQLQAVTGVDTIEFIVSNEDYYQDNHARYQIHFVDDNYAASTTEAIEDMKVLLASQEYYMTGEAITSITYQDSIQSEIILIVIIIIPIVFLILFLTTHGWLDPLLIIIVVLVSVIINMGTNIIFSNISYMTHATCGILQLAICMDYAIIFIHSYRKARKEEDKYQALKKARKESFPAILGSSLTTLVGFVALLFMRYQIGFDIGIVLIKGVLISVLMTMILLPSLLLLMDKWILKSIHRPLFQTHPTTYSFLRKTRWVIPFVFLFVIGFSFYMQTKNEFIYSEQTIAYESKDLANAKEEIENTFGAHQTFSILFEKDILQEQSFLIKLQSICTEQEIVLHNWNSPLLFLSPYSQAELNAVLTGYGLDGDSITGIIQVFQLMSLEQSKNQFSLIEIAEYIPTSAFLTAEQKTSFLPFTVMISNGLDKLVSESYHLFVFQVDLAIEGQKTTQFIEQLTLDAKDISEEALLLSEGIVVHELQQVIQADYWKINIITISLIFLILLALFRSLFIPVLLVLLIEGAIWMNMAVPALLGNSLLYLGYIIVSAILLGATIDYAILFASRYQDYRKEHDKKETTLLAFEETKSTVITSGIILIVAGFCLGWVSQVPSIAAFGLLIGRGALMSTILVLFVLPQTFFILDTPIQKTTLHQKNSR
ncbi:MAG: efflux RND transporter permease subunit [Bacilli bacterium]|jgi:predicted RND superfamily exporter protein|nr:efflux RND transporter permease subunit [Bacilli bacterium]